MRKSESDSSEKRYRKRQNHEKSVRERKRFRNVVQDLQNMKVSDSELYDIPQDNYERFSRKWVIWMCVWWDYFLPVRRAFFFFLYSQWKHSLRRISADVSHATIWSDDWRSKSRVSAICMFGMLSIQFAVVLRRGTPTQIEERRSDRFQSYIGRCRTRVWYAGQQEVSRVWMAQATVFHFRMAPPRVLL